MSNQNHYRCISSLLFLLITSFCWAIPPLPEVDEIGFKARIGDWQGVAEFLDSVNDLNATDSEYWILRYAVEAESDQTEIIDKLIDKGVLDTFDHDAEAYSSLIALSIYINKLPLARYFLSKVTETEHLQIDDLDFSRHFFSTLYNPEGRMERVRFYIEELGMDVDVTADSPDSSPLFLAVEFDSFDAFLYLIEKGASIENSLNRGELLMLHAALNGNLEIIKYLYTFDPSLINQASPLGQTPIMASFASDKGTEEVIYQLLDLGADPCLKSEEGMNAMDYAIRLNRHAELISGLKCN